MDFSSEALAWLIRRHALELTHKAHASHIGSVFSVADIVAVLYSGVLKVNPDYPDDPDRDIFVLSKGHAGLAVYAALAERGFFERELLNDYYQDASHLLGHISHKVSGVEASTGSLGHGFPLSVGFALAKKLSGSNACVYCVTGDGECDEGSIWEAALFAAHNRLDNLILIIDYNKFQSLDTCQNTLALEPLDDKWRAFGFNVRRVFGHDHDEIKAVIADILANPNDKPTVIIADTIKGYGVSYMESKVLWHYRFPHAGDEYDQALRELEITKPLGLQDPYKP